MGQQSVLLASCSVKQSLRLVGPEVRIVTFALSLNATGSIAASLMPNCDTCTFRRGGGGRTGGGGFGLLSNWQSTPASLARS